MANHRGRYEHRGRYLEIERPNRLRFTRSSAATQNAETIVTLMFESTDDGTRLTLVHVDLPDDTAAARHESGWQSILRKCDESFAGATSPAGSSVEWSLTSARWRVPCRAAALHRVGYGNRSGATPSESTIPTTYGMKTP